MSIIPGMIVRALAVFVAGFVVGQSFSIAQHRARCTELGGIPVTQFIDRVETVLCQQKGERQ